MPQITYESDDTRAREAAARQGDRLQEKIQALYASGRFAEAERLQLAWERADTRSKTWGECYLRLLAL